MKLQKLVYFTHGWWLAINEFSLLNERPQVWTHGPVFKSLYHILKSFGLKPISETQLSYPTADLELVQGNNIVPSYLDFVWQRYGHLSSFALSGMTHQPNGAWNKVAAEHGFKVTFDTEIPDKYVREEFVRLLNEERSRSGEEISE